MAIGVLKYRKYQEQREGLTKGKWYAKAVQDRTVDFEDFVTHMSEHNSPFSRGMIKGVLTDMLACVKELVLDGKSVRLGDLGLISVGMSTIPADTRESFNVATNVTGVHLNVRNTKTWSNAELRKSVRLEELTAYDAPDTPTGGGDTESPDEI